MGKSCSCISVPKEHGNASKHSNMEENIAPISDLQYTELPKSNYDPEVTSLVTNGYIRLTLKSFGINITDIPTPKYTNIISICSEYYDNDMPLIRKRCIFTSIMHLNLCIDEIPLNILDESIFCFKMNQQELFSHIIAPNSNQNNNQNHSFGPLMLSLSSSTTFKPLLIQYVKHKQKQGLLLLLQDNKDWNDISLLLENISDTFYMNNRKYNPLKTDIKFWKQEYKKACFTVPLQDIICELNQNNLKYYPSMEIIKQSNPTLIPMKTFDFYQYKLQNGCHGMTWIDDRKYNINYNYANIQIKRMINNNINEISMESSIDNFTYCVGEEEFLQSDSENEITINSQEILQSHQLYGFNSDDDYD